MTGEKKMIGKIVGFSMTVLMLLLIFAIAPVVAQGIAGSRTLSDTTVAPGDTFTVTVNVDITGTVHTPVLNETLPAGWTATEVDNGGASYYNLTETKWVWFGAQTTDKTVVYEVTVPLGTAYDTYPVTGTVLAAVGGSIIGPFTVTGDDTAAVTVTECPGDFTGDGYRNIEDIVYFVNNLWGPGTEGDFTGDGYRNIEDIVYFVNNLWGMCP